MWKKQHSKQAKRNQVKPEYEEVTPKYIDSAYYCVMNDKPTNCFNNIRKFNMAHYTRSLSLSHISTRAHTYFHCPTFSDSAFSARGKIHINLFIKWNCKIQNIRLRFKNFDKLNRTVIVHLTFIVGVHETLQIYSSVDRSKIHSIENGMDWCNQKRFRIQVKWQEQEQKQQRKWKMQWKEIVRFRTNFIIKKNNYITHVTRCSCATIDATAQISIWYAHNSGICVCEIEMSICY